MKGEGNDQLPLSSVQGGVRDNRNGCASRRRTARAMAVTYVLQYFQPTTTDWFFSVRG